MKINDPKQPESNCFSQVVITDILANIMVVSHLSEMLPGFPTAGDIGKSLFDFFEPDKTESLELIKRRLVEGEHFNATFHQKNNSSLPEKIESDCFPMAGTEDGHALATWMLKMAPETQEKYTLADEDSTYREILNSITEAVYIQDEQGVFLYVNNAALELYNLNREDVIGKTPEFLAAPGKNDLQQISLSLRNAFKGIHERFKFWGIKANGNEFLKEVNLTLGKYHGQPVVIAVSRDITEKVATETQRDEALQQLTSSQNLLAAIIRTAKDSVLVKDRELRYLFVNEARAELFGLQTTDFIGKTDLELFGPTEAEQIEIVDKQVLQGEVVERFPSREINGEERYFHSIKVPIFDQSGKVWALCGISRDITDKKLLLAEKENVISRLKKSEDRYRSVSQMLRLMCDNVPDMIWAKDRNKQFIFTNKAVCNNLLNAQNTDEPTGKSDLFFAQRERNSHPNDPDYHTFGEICRDSDQIVMDSLKAQRFDEFGNVKSEFLFLDVYKAPFFNEVGEMIGTVGCGRDVTAERKLQQQHLQIEEELKAKTSRMNAMISAIPDMLFVIDSNGIFVDFLASVVHRLVIPKEKIVGASLYDVFSPEKADEQMRLFKECLKTGALLSFTYSLNLDNEIFHYEARVSKMDENHVLTSVKEITNSVRMEAEIEHRTRLNNLLMELATRFINIPYKKVEDEINRAIAEMGEFTQSDRVYIFDYDYEKDIQINTYEWCSEGTSPEIDNLKAVPNSAIPEWVAAHQRGEPTQIKKLSDLPASSNLRQILEPQSIQSLITIPLMHEGNCLGYIGFDAVKQEKTWTEDEISLLQMFAQLLTNLKIKSGIEGALITREEQFRQLLNDLPDIVLVHQNESIVYANKAALDEVGYNLEDFTGKNIMDFVLEEDKPIVINNLRKRLTSQTVEDYEIHVRAKNNEIRDVIVRTSEIVFFGKKSVVIILIDITHRKRAEGQLRESEEKFRNLAQLAPFAIMIYQDEKWVYTNHAGEIISGYLADELYQMNYWEFVVPELQDLIRNRGVQRQSGEYVPSEYEFRIRTKSGTEKWVILNGSLIDYKGKPAGLISVADITELKLIEAELLKAKEKVEKSDKLKSAFMNNISHEIRTPLNSIVGFTDLMLNKESIDEEKELYSNYLKTSCYRLIQTITDYMDSSIIVSGNQEVKLSLITPSIILRDLYNQYTESAKAKNLIFDLQLKDDVANLQLESDPELLKKILNHLLSNAFKFTSRGKVLISAEVKDRSLIISVEDTGVGISSEAMHYIFDYYRQEDQSSIRPFEGSGLGLSIAKGLAACLNGDLWVNSQKNIGSTFHLSIPVSKFIDCDENATIGKSETQKSSTKVVLLVEDEFYNIQFMLALLKRNNYAEVLLATTGFEAIEKCLSHPEINIVLMDLKLPEMNGYDATRQIKEIRKDLPVIAITAFAMSGDENKALEAGCDDYITKPISKDFLISKIEKFCS